MVAVNLKCKKMKTKILVIILTILSITACDESFLDIASENELTINGTYKTESDFEQAINGVYATLRSLHDKSVFAMGETRSDNAYYDYNADNRGQVDHEYIADFLNLSANATADDKYIQNYLVIARANQIISTIDDGEFFDLDLKDNIKGQALFLRALAYFDLVQYFGSVPLHLKPASSLEESALPLSSVDDIYKAIIDDAKQAAILLPPKSNQGEGRATMGAAKTLLGNAYVVRKNWPDAVTILKEIENSKEYNLLENYADVFDPNNKNNEESVFEVQFKDVRNYGSRFVYLLMPAKMKKEDVAAITGTSTARSRNGDGTVPTPDLLEAYEAEDTTRLNVTIGYAISDGVDTLPYVKKYNHPHLEDGRTGNNFPTYRYAEVLLLLAEALNESGSGDPLPYLNAVRNRAGLVNSTASGQSAIRDAILAERRVELAFECKRWLDLVRTGRAETVMKAFGKKVIANPEDYYFPEAIGPVPGAFDNIETEFPIPALEQELNPNF